MADDRIVLTDDDLGLAQPAPATPEPAMPRVAPAQPAIEIVLNDEAPPMVQDAAPLSTTPEARPVPAASPAPAVRPAAAAEEAELASIGSRVGAALIDSAIFVGAVLVVVALQAAGIPAVLGTLVLFGAAAAIWAAPMGREGHRNGQTFGMQTTGIRKVRDDGAPFTAGTAQAWYWLSSLALSLVVIGALANVVAPLFTAERRSLRDLLMRTTTRQV